MSPIKIHTIIMLTSLVSLTTARAHFPILIHNAELGVTNRPVVVTYAVGHPFELEMERAARPEQVRLIDAHGRSISASSLLVKTQFRQDTNGIAWNLQFDPARGDTIVALDSSAEVDSTQKSLYCEYVKVCVHRAVQGGWTNRTGQPLEIVPLTRPYGIRPGMVFSGLLMRGREPMADTEVYAERLSDNPPEKSSIPAEPLVTFTARTDAQGRFVLTLPDPGWWIIGAYANELGPIRHEGKDYSHEAFAGFWMRVEPR